MRPIDRCPCSGPRRASTFECCTISVTEMSEAEQHRDGDRHAHDDQRRGADDHVDDLVQRMAQHTVQAVEAADAMMHGVQPPQRREPMAEVVHHHEGEVGDDERDRAAGAHSGHSVGHNPWNGNSQTMSGMSSTPLMLCIS